MTSVLGFSYYWTQPSCVRERERERERESVEPTGYGTQKEGELSYEVQPTNEQERAKRS